MDRDDDARTVSLSASLEQSLRRYLELRIKALEADEAARIAKERQERMQAQVGKVVTPLTALFLYALLLGILTHQLLRGALLDEPMRAFGDFFKQANGQQGAITGIVPEAIRGFAIAGFSTLALLALRAAPLSLRSDLGGAIFMGVVALALVGLSAAASSGPLGIAAAVPGLIAAVLITYGFLQMLTRIEQQNPRGPAPAWQLRLATSLRPFTRPVRQFLAPSRNGAVRLLFRGLPVVSVAAVLAAVPTNGGPLFWLARTGIYAFLLWCLWAIVVTPLTVRIPLWSLAAWSALFLILFAYGTVALVFASAVIVVLVVNVTLAT